eukprot:TRINITY_DN67074_c6_g1_i1.p1 TRINITY_DN67074_c6_g1~~TRINITY_DN67074_c6_g1_i1.p1  ORF type:complete len:284 (-),score=30.86 TRINITY_DN67074_c6_g1_i1:60-911(-)
MAVRYSPADTHELLNNNKATVIDIRDQDDYNKSHIAGAVNIPKIFYYLLPSSCEDGLKDFSTTFQELFRQAGVSNDKKVLIYEESLDGRYGGSCRGYFMLKYFGHPDVGIVDGGMKAWLEAGLPVDQQAPPVTPSSWEPSLQNQFLALKDEVLSAISEGSGITLLDDRDKDEWCGHSSSPYGIDFVPRKGRLPGAKWIEWYDFMDRTGDIAKFKSKEDILALTSAQGINPTDNVIIYCFKGARASNTFLALEEAGFTSLKIYLGSWNEWSKTDLPIDEAKYDM